MSVVCDLPRRRSKTAKLGAADIAAIGITNQRETSSSGTRRPGKPIHNAIVWQDRRTSAALPKAEGGKGLEKKFSQQDRAAARSVFLGHQDRLAARQCEGRAPARRARRTAGGHRRHLPDLAADWRQGACHRRDQCLAHAALQHRDQPLGRRASGDPADPRGNAARGQGLRRRFRGHAKHRCSVRRSRSSALPATSRPRRSARPASSRA